jgi:hypothetical protein
LVNKRPAKANAKRQHENEQVKVQQNDELANAQYSRDEQIKYYLQQIELRQSEVHDIELLLTTLRDYSKNRMILENISSFTPEELAHYNLLQPEID